MAEGQAPDLLLVLGVDVSQVQAQLQQLGKSLQIPTNLPQQAAQATAAFGQTAREATGVRTAIDRATASTRELIATAAMYRAAQVEDAKLMGQTNASRRAFELENQRVVAQGAVARRAAEIAYRQDTGQTDAMRRQAEIAFRQATGQTEATRRQAEIAYRQATGQTDAMRRAAELENQRVMERGAAARRAAEVSYRQSVAQTSAQSARAAEIDANTRVSQLRSLQTMQQQMGRLVIPSTLEPQAQRIRQAFDTLSTSTGRLSNVEFRSLRESMTQVVASSARMETATRGITEQFGRSIVTVAKYYAAFQALQAVMSGFRSVVDLDTTLVKIEALMEDGADRARTLKNSYDLVSLGMTSLGLSSKESGDLVFELSKVLNNNAELMKAAYIPALTLTGLNEANQGDLIKVLVGLYSIYGDSIQGAADDTAKFARINDMMIAGSVQSVASVGSLAESIRLVGPRAKEAGVSIEELIAVVALSQNTMLTASMAGTGFNNVLKDLATRQDQIGRAFDIDLDPTKPLEGMKLFLLILEKLQTEGPATAETMKKLQIAFPDMRGSREALAFMQVMGQYPEVLRKVTESQGRGAQALDTLQTAVTAAAGGAWNTLILQVDRFFSALTGTQPGKFEFVSTALRQIQAAMTAVGDIAAWAAEKIHAFYSSLPGGEAGSILNFPARFGTSVVKSLGLSGVLRPQMPAPGTPAAAAFGYAGELVGSLAGQFASSTSSVDTSRQTASARAAERAGYAPAGYSAADAYPAPVLPPRGPSLSSMARAEMLAEIRRESILADQTAPLEARIAAGLADQRKAEADYAKASVAYDSVADEKNFNDMKNKAKEAEARRRKVAELRKDLLSEGIESLAFEAKQDFDNEERRSTALRALRQKGIETFGSEEDIARLSPQTWLIEEQKKLMALPGLRPAELAEELENAEKIAREMEKVAVATIRIRKSAEQLQIEEARLVETLRQSGISRETEAELFRLDQGPDAIARAEIDQRLGKKIEDIVPGGFTEEVLTLSADQIKNITNAQRVAAAERRNLEAQENAKHLTEMFETEQKSGQERIALTAQVTARRLELTGTEFQRFKDGLDRQLFAELMSIEESSLAWEEKDRLIGDTYKNYGTAVSQFRLTGELELEVLRAQLGLVGEAAERAGLLVRVAKGGTLTAEHEAEVTRLAKIANETKILADIEALREAGYSEGVARRMILDRQAAESREERARRAIAAIEEENTRGERALENSIRLQSAQAQQSGNFVSFFIANMRLAGTVGQDFWTGLAQLASTTSRAMTSALSDGFFGLITGKIDSLKDAWESLKNTMLRALTDFLASLVVRQFLEFLAAATGLTGSTGGGITLGGGGGSGGGGSTLGGIGASIGTAVGTKLGTTIIGDLFNRGTAAVGNYLNPTAGMPAGYNPAGVNTGSIFGPPSPSGFTNGTSLDNFLSPSPISYGDFFQGGNFDLGNYGSGSLLDSSSFDLSSDFPSASPMMFSSAGDEFMDESIARQLGMTMSASTGDFWPATPTYGGGVSGLGLDSFEPVTGGQANFTAAFNDESFLRSLVGDANSYSSMIASGAVGTQYAAASMSDAGGGGMSLAIAEQTPGAWDAARTYITGLGTSAGMAGLGSAISLGTGLGLQAVFGVPTSRAEAAGQQIAGKVISSVLKEGAQTAASAGGVGAAPTSGFIVGTQNFASNFTTGGLSGVLFGTAGGATAAANAAQATALGAGANIATASEAAAAAGSGGTGATGGFFGSGGSALGAGVGVAGAALSAGAAAWEFSKAFHTLAQDSGGMVSEAQRNSAYGALTGLAAGAVIGTIINPGYGTAIGAALGAAGGSMIGGLFGDEVPPAIHNKIERARTAMGAVKEIYTRLANVRSEQQLFDAMHARMGGSAGSVGQLLYSMAYGNLVGEFIGDPWQWKPNPAIGALIPLLESMGITSGADFNVDRVNSKNELIAASGRNPVEGAQTWDNLLEAFSGSAVSQFPGLQVAAMPALDQMGLDLRFGGFSTGRPGTSEIMGSIDGSPGALSSNIPSTIEGWNTWIATHPELIGNTAGYGTMPAWARLMRLQGINPEDVTYYRFHAGLGEFSTAGFSGSDSIGGGYATGGWVTGSSGRPGSDRYGRGPQTTDSVPAWLSLDEFVMPASSARIYGSELEAMRRGDYSGQMDVGGISINVNVSGGGNPSEIGTAVARAVRQVMTDDSMMTEMAKSLYRVNRRRGLGILPDSGRRSLYVGTN